MSYMAYEMPTGDLGPVIAWVAYVAVVITTITVLLRFYVRLLMQHRFALDDYLMAWAQSNFIFLCAAILKQVHYGMGKHMMAIFMTNPENIALAGKWWYIGQLFVLTSTCTVKIALCIFFCSLRPPPLMRHICIATVAFSTASGIGTMLYQLFQCWPVSYFWLRGSPGAQGACLAPEKAFPIIVSFNTFDLITDTILAILPCYLVSTLKMSLKKKFTLGVLLGLGMLCAITPFIRSFFLHRMCFDASDFTWNSVPVTVTLITEPAIAITVVCLAQLRPLMQLVMPKTWSGTNNSGPGQKRTPLRTFGQGSDRKKNSTLSMSDYEMTIKDKDSQIEDTNGSKMDSIDLEYGSRVNIVPPETVKH